jgi:hypothetical protein
MTDSSAVAAPLWFIGGLTRIDLVTRGEPEIVVGHADQGPFVPVFRDRSLAEQFIGQGGREGCAPLALPTPRDWLRFLEILERQGHAHVALDPGAQPTRLPVARLITEAQQAIHRHEGP